MSSTALSPVLKSHTLVEARDCLLELDQELQIIPPVSREALLAGMDTLLWHAQDQTMPNLHKIMERVELLITCASGIEQARRTRFLAANEAEPLHFHRNLLQAMVLAGVINYRGEAAPIASRFPVLKPRFSTGVRPNTDDEQLLQRMWALHLSGGNKNNRRAAAVFAQCDAGMAAGETTQVKEHEVALTPDKPHIEAPGHQGGVRERDVPLDAFSAELLRRYVEGANLTPGSYLTYRPRANTKCAATAANDPARYAAACASAIGIIDRIRKAVGLKHIDTTSASTWMWRAATTATLKGAQAAIDVSGRTEENLFGLLNNGTKTYKRPPTNKPRTLDDI